MGEKTMRRRSFLVFLTVFYVLFTSIGGIQGNASSGTTVRGIINQNTIWTVASSPYSLSGDIQIANGVKLTVEPGVTIEGNNFRIRDFGEFEAVGNPDSKIIFNNVNIEPGAGDYSKRFLIHIEKAVINQGSLYRPTGGAIYGSLILKDTRLSNLSDFLYLWYPKSDVYIEQNVFINSGGISVGTSDNVTVHIFNNVFYNYKNFAIENWASYAPSETIVSYNSFINPKDSTGYALVLPASYSNSKMTAANNYWGTTDEALIEKMIFDKNDDLSSGAYVGFKPFLLDPDPNSPDITAPNTPSVNEVTDKSTSVTGTAEAGSTITVKAGTSVVGTAVTQDDGIFSVPIDLQKAETTLSLTATDHSGNVSEVKEVTVNDATAPTVQTVNEVTDKSTRVTGTAEAGSTITVKAGTSLVGTAVTQDDGTFSIPINLQRAGTTLSVTANDHVGNVSEAKEVIVRDVTQPTFPIVNSIDENSTYIYGYAEAGATVTAVVNGVEIGSAVVNSNGFYQFYIDQQNAYTEILITAVDLSGNVSEPTRVIVKDVTAPVKPEVNEVTDKETSVTGQAEAGSKVEVKVNDSVIGSGTAGEDGQYKVTISAQKAGTEFVIIATDKAGNVSEITTTVVKDVTAPVKPKVNEVTDKDTSVTGQAEAGSKVEVKVNDSVIGSGTAGEDGQYKVTISTQKAGTELVINATDKAGNVSDAATIKVIDKTAPSVLTVNTVSDKTKEVTGKTEAGATVSILTGTKIYVAIADTNGNFKVIIPAQKAGTKLIVSAKDAAGNVSMAKSITVIDKTAPGTPTVSTVSDLRKVVAGKAEVGAIVTVTIGTKKYIAKADSRGNYKVTIPVKKAGTMVIVTAKDAAGNVSAAKSVIVIDKTAPLAPKIKTTVKSTTKEVTGTAEAYATITIKVGKKVIGTAKTDSKGKFKVKIKVQKKKTVLSVTATDRGKNVSKAATVKVK
ncbi:Ig-like domain-containing protein [Neobacillus drentensis]|uniref:Ig-like domain-containing protein n=2 Tax=Neobacillus drentensis TaxID=220684 RepID=UPI001C3F3226|nr:Ig-like domain-containing protein [Neobacillus drentensis]